ncbi:MAG: glycoside hydrolase family 2 TIM barrel-domain containing protein, partial [Fimbriimonadaceae bacterium]
DRNHPAIIGWCPFNETPDSAARLQKATVNLTRQLDPSRPVIETSGWAHHLPDPEVMDAHDYDQNPQSFRQRWNAASSPLPDRYSTNFKFEIPFMISEFGGIGWDTGKGWGYGAAPKTLEEFYARFEGLCKALMDNPDMFGFCYTQLTDVEQERNGMYTYDRKPKFDVAKIHKMLSSPAAFETGALPKPQVQAHWMVLVASARDNGTNWRYTETDPGASWTGASFQDQSWKSGPGGFGSKGGFEKDVRTTWKTPDIWLRQRFEYDGSKYSEAWMPIHFDNATEVYLNGQVIWKSEPKTWNDGYAATDVTEAVKKALKTGDNVIAVHTHQDDGGQFIDLALLLKG